MYLKSAGSGSFSLPQHKTSVKIRVSVPVGEQLHWLFIEGWGSPASQELLCLPRWVCTERMGSFANPSSCHLTWTYLNCYLSLRRQLRITRFKQCPSFLGPLQRASNSAGEANPVLVLIFNFFFYFIFSVF